MKRGLVILGCVWALWSVTGGHWKVISTYTDQKECDKQADFIARFIDDVPRNHWMCLPVGITPDQTK